MKITAERGILHAVIEIDLENVPDYVYALLEGMQLLTINKIDVDAATMDNLLGLVKLLQFSSTQTGHIALKRDPTKFPEE